MLLASFLVAAAALLVFAGHRPIARWGPFKSLSNHQLEAHLGSLFTVWFFTAAILALVALTRNDGFFLILAVVLLVPEVITALIFGSVAVDAFAAIKKASRARANRRK